MAVEKIPQAEFLARLKDQGVPLIDSAVICPMCKTVQSPKSFQRAGVPNEKINGQIGFSCVGRWTGAGPHMRDAPPGAGCDWTRGGLITIHELEVELPDGKVSPAMIPATTEQAQELARKNAE